MRDGFRVLVMMVVVLALVLVRWGWVVVVTMVLDHESNYFRLVSYNIMLVDRTAPDAGAADPRLQIRAHHELIMGYATEKLAHQRSSRSHQILIKCSSTAEPLFSS